MNPIGDLPSVDTSVFSVLFLVDMLVFLYSCNGTHDNAILCSICNPFSDNIQAISLASVWGHLGIAWLLLHALCTHVEIP